jgi:hypothetical protein
VAALTGVIGFGGSAFERTEDFNVGCVAVGVAVGVVVVAVVVVDVAGFGGALTFGFASSGKIRGMAAAQIQRSATEITIAAKIRFSISGNRVPTSRIEDVTTRQPSHPQPAAAEQAVLFDGLHHIHRARRLEATHRRQDRGDETFVETKQRNSDTPHRRSAPTLFRHARQRAAQILTVIGERGVDGIRLHIHHEVESLAVERPLPSIDLTRPALEAIARVRFSDLSCRGDSDAGVGQTVRGEEQNGVAREKLAAGFVHVKKLATLRQPLIFRQRLGPLRVCCALHRLAAPLDSEALATLATAARQHRLTILRPHADEETVRALPAAVVRLKSALHDLTSGQTQARMMLIPREEKA